MRLLIDTHAFLWFVTNDQLLSATALGLMTDPINEIVISPASFWGRLETRRKSPTRGDWDTWWA